MVWCRFLNMFCFVCGHYIKNRPKPEKSNFSEVFKDGYMQYYGPIALDVFDREWTPNSACKNCYNRMNDWLEKRRDRMPFGTPMGWTEDPNGHNSSSCYGCVNNKHFAGMNKRTLRKAKYQSTDYASLPHEHTEGNPPPKPPSPDRVTGLSFSSTSTAKTDENDPIFDPYEPFEFDDGPEVLTQIDMDYLVAILGLSQRSSEFLATFLKRRKLTNKVNATAYRNRQASFQIFFAQDPKNSFTFCTDIAGLATAMGINYIAEEWRLFIDGSVNSLKFVLLHISNKKPAIPLAYSTKLKESYENLSEIMKAIKYADNLWKICGDLKVINIL